MKKTIILLAACLIALLCAGWALAEEGVSRIIAVPLFIANGVHLGEEIPEQLGIPAYSEGGDIEIGGRKIQLVYTKPVEADPRLTDIIVAKAREFLGE